MKAYSAQRIFFFDSLQTSASTLLARGITLGTACEDWPARFEAFGIWPNGQRIRVEAVAELCELAGRQSNDRVKELDLFFGRPIYSLQSTTPFHRLPFLTTSDESDRLSVRRVRVQLLMEHLFDLPLVQAGLSRLERVLACAGGNVAEFHESARRSVFCEGDVIPIAMSGMVGALELTALRSSPEFDALLYIVNEREVHAGDRLNTIAEWKIFDESSRVWQQRSAARELCQVLELAQE